MTFLKTSRRMCLFMCRMDMVFSARKRVSPSDPRRFPGG